MDFKVFYKKINFDIDNEIRTVYQVTQGDTKSRGLLVDLIVGGVKTPVTTETMSFFALKPDGTRVMTVGVKDGDKFRIDFTNQTFAVPGVLLCALVLYGTNGEKIADRKFKMTVDSSMEDGAIVSEDERGILDRAFDLASDIVPRLEALDVPLLENLEQEVTLARGTEATLGARLDATDAQLAETASKFKLGKNLFNKNTVSAINTSLNVTTGQTGVSLGNQTSDFIPVEPATDYRRTYGGDSALIVCYYDITKAFISGGQIAPAGSPSGIPILTPANCHYVRTAWTINKPSVDIMQFEKGTVVTQYEPYQKFIGKEHIEGLKDSDVPARISSLEKDTIKFNGDIIRPVTNLIKNGNFVDTSLWTPVRGTRSVNSNVLTLIGDGTHAKPLVQSGTSKAVTIGQNYYVRAKARVTNADCIRIELQSLSGLGSAWVSSPEQNKWYDISYIATSNVNSTLLLAIASQEYADSATALGKVLELKDVMCFDLSVDFGLGINPPFHLLDKMMEYNNYTYWEGTSNVIVRNTLDDNNNNFNKVDDTVLFNKNIQHSKRRPIISFTADDGWEADYTKLKIFSEMYGVPFTSFILPNSTLKIYHGLELQNDFGWEFGSHGGYAGGLDTLATEEEIEYELKSSKEILTSRGYDIKCVSYPHGTSDERVRRLAKKHYNCGFSGESGINTGVIGSFYIKRYALGSFLSWTLEQYKTLIDDAVAQNGWLIFVLHPNSEEHTEAQQDKIHSIIQYIQSLNVDIMTVSDGYEVFGNALEIGDYIGGEDGLAISKTGERKNI